MKKDQKKSPTFVQNAQSYFSQFCGATSIHGVQFLGETGRFIIEKLIWLVYITLISCCLIYLILKAYNKWVTQPVIVSFSTTETPVWEIPFPAVTICPEVKCDPKTYNYSDVLLRGVKNGTVSDREREVFRSMTLVCTGLSELGAFDEYDDLSTVPSPYKDLLGVAVDADVEYFVSVNWLGQNVSSDVLFKTFTSEGLCYSFNAEFPFKILKPGSEHIWNVSDEYDRDADKGNGIVYPRRSFTTGPDGGFSITLYTNDSHLDYLCRFFQGFKVTIHSPFALPDMDQHFRLPLDHQLSMGVIPNMIKVGDELKPYQPEGRQCYFQDEKPLAFYKNYSQENCLNECFSNYTLKRCECRAFYMVGITNTTPICGPKSYTCVHDSKVEFIVNQDIFKQLTEAEAEADDFDDCGCLASCTKVEYNAETSQSPLDWKKAYKMFAKLGQPTPNIDYTKDHITILNVYYKELQFLSAERHELYGYVDFFSNIGGLLGLFIGISVTSVVELLYFLTLRLACNIQKYGRRFWSGDEELIAASENTQI